MTRVTRMARMARTARMARMAHTLARMARWLADFYHSLLFLCIARGDFSEPE